MLIRNKRNKVKIGSENNWRISGKVWIWKINCGKWKKKYLGNYYSNGIGNYSNWKRDKK